MEILLTYVTNKAVPFGESIGLYYLAASLERAGYDTRVFCGRPESLLRHLDTGSPLILGFYCDYNNLPLVVRISNKICREHGLTMLAGGPQSMAMGEPFLRESGCTFILRGEGEYTLPKLMECLLHGSDELDDVQGLCYIENGEYRENIPAEQIKDLDSLPMPAYHLSLDPDQFIGSAVLTGRGCPYSCSYCAKPHGTGIRLRNIGSVLEEIRRNLDANPHIRYIIINDDTFVVNRERIIEFCTGMRAICDEKKVGWFCQCHVATMSEWSDLLPIMLDSGLIRLQIGIESGDRHALDLYNKHTTPEDLERFVALAYKAGVPQLEGNIIIGGPLEREGETLGLIRRLLYAAPGVLDISTGFLRSYPGTRITEHPEEFGLEILNKDSCFTDDDYPSIVPKGMDADDVVRMRHACNREIRAVMKEIIDAHILSDNTAARQFEIMDRHLIRSRWVIEMEMHNFAGTYYKMMTAGYGGPLSDNPDFTRCYPSRTFDLWKTVLYDNGYPEINGYPLSPLENEIITHCSGELNLAELETMIFGQFGAPFVDRKGFVSYFLSILQGFNRKYWVSFYTLNFN